MDVCLIQVPSMAGDDRHPSRDGPRRLVEGGAVDVLAARGVDVAVELVEREGSFRDTASSAAAVNGRVATLVRQAAAAGRLPVALAGSCNACLGVLGGFEHARCGAVWLDAHADFNTPESTVSGFFPGMSLAIATGHCYRAYWARIGDATPLAEEHVALFGVRDVSPDAERERLERSGITMVEWEEGRPRGDVDAALAALAQRVDEVYLHLDLDAFAPDVAPGVVDEPVPGGLTVDQAEAIVREAAARFRVRAATLATYTPERDVEDRTLRAALRMLDVLGGTVATGSR